MSKIAFISIMGASPWGGSEYLWTDAAKEALQDGHDVAVSIYDWSVDHPIIRQLVGLRCKVLPRQHDAQVPSLPKKIFRKLLGPIRPRGTSPYQSIFDEQPDTICVSQGSACDIRWFPDLAKLLMGRRIPYVIVCQHNTELSIELSGRQLLRDVFQKASQVLFVSQHNLDLAQRQLACLLPNAQVIQNPVNLSSLDREVFPESKKIRFASVARFDTFNKGQDILFESLSREQWKMRNWECNLYGNGPDREYLESLAKVYGIADKVNFKGHVDNVRQIWVDNHLLVMPSRAEGTPLALVEAMVCGRASVVTDVGGNMDWVDEGCTGFIAEAPTTRSFQSALERAWAKRDLWEEMGIKAHAMAINKIDRTPGVTLLTSLLSLNVQHDRSKILVNT